MMITMGVGELRLNIHKYIDQIHSESLLIMLHDFLKGREADLEGGHWSKLTAEQQAEVLLAYDESEDGSNLLDRSEVFGRR